MTSGQQLPGAFTTTVAGEVSNVGGAMGALCTGYTLVFNKYLILSSRLFCRVDFSEFVILPSGLAFCSPSPLSQNAKLTCTLSLCQVEFYTLANPYVKSVFFFFHFLSVAVLASIPAQIQS